MDNVFAQFNALVRVSGSELIRTRLRNILLERADPRLITYLNVMSNADLRLFSAFTEGIIDKSKTSYIKIFMILDTYHDIFEGARSKTNGTSADIGLQNYAIALFGLDPKHPFPGFFEKFIEPEELNIKTFADTPSPNQLNRFSAAAQESIRAGTLTANDWKQMVTTYAAINTTKFIGHISFDQAKSSFLREVILLQQLAGKVMVIGNKFSTESDPQFTLSDIKKIVVKNGFKLCVDTNRYAKTGSINIVGMTSVPQNNIAVNVTQLADSATTETPTHITYIDGTSDQEMMNYIKEKYKDVLLFELPDKPGDQIPYRAIPQCESKQLHFTFQYYFITTDMFKGHSVQVKDISKASHTYNIAIEKRGKKVIQKKLVLECLLYHLVHLLLHTN